MHSFFIVAIAIFAPLFTLNTNASDDNYQPKIKAWPYSIPNSCDAIHDNHATVVTLQKHERLQSAVERLRKISPSGGVIEIQAKNETIECDTIRLKQAFSSGLTLRGIGMPEFYCRWDNPKYGGTIKKADLKPAFFTAHNDDHTVLVEGIEVNGYKSAFKLGKSGDYTLRNLRAHGGPGDGISNSNTGGPGKDPYRGIETPSRFRLQACGVEVSHYGQGNHKHNFYIHRALGGWPRYGFDTRNEFTLVDSNIHSPGWASAVKSIANRNNFYNNTITSHIFGEEGFHAQMLIDVSACSVNIIVGNLLRNFKPTKRAGGSAVVGLRGRRTAMRGCDIPITWYPYTNTFSAIPLARDPSHPVHSEKWWSELNGKIWFPSIIYNNTIEVLCVSRDAW